MRYDRHGFTIVELLVVTVLGSLLLMSIYQVLVTNQRTYRDNAEQVQGQQTARIVLDILAAELREASSAGGDVKSVSTTEITYDVMTKLGIVCGVTYGSPVTLTVVRYEEWFAKADSLLAFADNRPETTDDDTWIKANITGSDTSGIDCDGRPAHDLKFTGQDAKFLDDSVRSGAPVRAFEHREYSLHQSTDGSYWLARTAGGSTDRLAGPLAPGGIAFEYYDQDGNTTTSASAVHRIEITATAEDGTSLTTSVFPRN